MRRAGLLGGAVMLAAAIAAPAAPAAGAASVALPSSPPAVVAASTSSPTSVSGWPRSLKSAVPAAWLTVAVVVRSAGGRAGRVVVVQRWRPVAGTWTAVVRARTDRGGRALLRWTAPSEPGRFSYRVRVVPTPRSRSAVSAAAAVRVVAAPTTTVAGQLVAAVNTARASARTCGRTHYPAVAPLRADATLQRAAALYAQRMGREGFFAHVSPSGDGPGERITAQGYPWRTYGEDIAAGYGSVPDVMAGWLASPGHCAIIMGAGFADLGAARADVPGSPYGSYWVLDFAHR